MTNKPWSEHSGPTGANYQSTGIYRSEQNCMMFTRTTHFCKVCSNAIEQLIDEYTK